MHSTGRSRLPPAKTLCRIAPVNRDRRLIRTGQQTIQSVIDKLHTAAPNLVHTFLHFGNHTRRSRRSSMATTASASSAMAETSRPAMTSLVALHCTSIA